MTGINTIQFSLHLLAALFMGAIVGLERQWRQIEVSALNIPDTKLDPLGGRGIGEIGITGGGAAVADALFHATGKRIRSAPITADLLMA
jgi:hypothetical protein